MPSFVCTFVHWKEKLIHGVPTQCPAPCWGIFADLVSVTFPYEGDDAFFMLQMMRVQVRMGQPSLPKVTGLISLNCQSPFLLEVATFVQAGCECALQTCMGWQPYYTPTWCMGAAQAPAMPRVVTPILNCMTLWHCTIEGIHILESQQTHSSTSFAADIFILIKINLCREIAL